ncbi:MAG: 16S rRNA (cytidine(1402)-2'-O)-methyltransferase [Bacteroidales bacterium]|nr:16S rRNA (cytidine(1402)-2'-O)-methyltransferase [Bacteroidales bacterium]
MSKLYVVPTPIGNFGDITIRAIEVLKQVDVILAEDTRTTSILLKHFNIENKLVSHHKFNEHKTAKNIVGKIQSGITYALVSDAGTPAISDPGFLLVRTCVENNIDIECLPGATAFVPALVNSGLPNDRFCFEGFLPQKKGRQKRLNQLTDETRTMIFYESPFRLIKTLMQFSEFFGCERQVSVSREISKIYEENVRGTITEVIDYFNEKKVKGEIVIVLQGAESKNIKS